MDHLFDKLLAGIWRSFKTFHENGAVKLNSETKFEEFIFDDEGNCTIQVYEGGRFHRQAEAAAWEISLKNGRHYLHIPALRANFELITVNHTVLVLHELLTGEKKFFSRKELWHEYLTSNSTLLM